MRHKPCSFQRSKAHVAPKLARADSLFASHHQMRDLEPITERLVGVLKDRSDQNREPIAVRGTLLALPMPLASFEVIDLGIAATRAMHAVRPAAGLQIAFAGVLVPDRKHGTVCQVREHRLHKKPRAAAAPQRLSLTAARLECRIRASVARSFAPQPDRALHHRQRDARRELSAHRATVVRRRPAH